jgi:hypothetical protein
MRARASSSLDPIASHSGRPTTSQRDSSGVPRERESSKLDLQADQAEVRRASPCGQRYRQPPHVRSLEKKNRLRLTDGGTGDTAEGEQRGCGGGEQSVSTY